LKIFYKRKIITYEDNDIYQTESPAKVPSKQPRATVKKKHISLCSSFFSDASHQSPKRPEEEAKMNLRTQYLHCHLPHLHFLK